MELYHSLSLLIDVNDESLLLFNHLNAFPSTFLKQESKVIAGWQRQHGDLSDCSTLIHQEQLPTDP